MVNVTYKASGSTLDMSGFGVFACMSSDDLRGWNWSRKSSNGVIAFELESRESTATISFYSLHGESVDSVRDACDRFFAACDTDIKDGSPGRLTIGDWYLDCYIVEGSCSFMRDDSCVYDVTFLAPHPYWRRETVIEIMPGTGERTSSIAGLNYPHNYPYNYGGISMGRFINVDALSSVDFRMTIYGAASNPYVWIGNNLYQVTVDVPSGGLLVIDSTKKQVRGKSIVLRDRYGRSSSVFSKRVKGAEGSGKYIFQPVPPGNQQVSWPQTFGITLALIESRSKFPWS